MKVVFKEEYRSFLLLSKMDGYIFDTPIKDHPYDVIGHNDTGGLIIQGCKHPPEYTAWWAEVWAEIDYRVDHSFSNEITKELTKEIEEVGSPDRVLMPERVFTTKADF